MRRNARFPVPSAKNRPPKPGSEPTFPKVGSDPTFHFEVNTRHITRVDPNMPRRPRSDLAGFPLHVIQRGNNRSDCFFSDADRSIYLERLGRYAEERGIAIHAWVLMRNHVHLLLTSPTPAHVSGLMQSLGRWYVQYINHRYGRTGTLWEGRYRACAVHAEDYLLACMRYIELNPVRAGLVAEPSDYAWSSYRCNALGHLDTLVSDHPLYTGFGVSHAQRQSAYRELFGQHLTDSTTSEIRSATASGHLLSSDRFRKEIESSRGVRLGPAPIGRPGKRKDAASTLNGNELLPLFD